MSLWRAKALELFPDMRLDIQKAESVGDWWITLADRFRNHYSSLDDYEIEDSPTLIRSICLYAVWCTRSRSPVAREMAWIEFYEQVPRYALRCKNSIYKKIVADLVKNLGYAELEKYQGTIGGYMKPDQLKKFMGDARHADQERERRSRKR